jgi:hypothetical protein
MIWEDGLQRAPAWILLRHVLVFCYSMGLTTVVPDTIWTTFLTAVVRNRSQPSLDAVIDAWISVADTLKGVGV